MAFIIWLILNIGLYQISKSITDAITGSLAVLLGFAIVNGAFGIFLIVKAFS